MALAVPLSRLTSLVGGGSAFYVRQHDTPPNMKTKEQTILWIAVVVLGAIALASVLPPLAAQKQRAHKIESVNNLAKPFPPFPR